MEITFKFWRKEALLQQKGWIQATHTDQIQSDTHFVIFLPTILIAWNFLLVVAWFLSVRYLQFFVHATTTQLLCTKFYNNHPCKHYIKFLWNWKFHWKILKLSQCPLSAGTFQLIPHKLRVQLWPGKFVGKFRTKMFSDLLFLESSLYEKCSYRTCLNFTYQNKNL